MRCPTTQNTRQRGPISQSATSVVLRVLGVQHCCREQIWEEGLKKLAHDPDEYMNNE